MDEIKSNNVEGNEISEGGKFIAGLLLIVLTMFSAIFLIGHWPDRLPTPDETLKPLYTFEWFNVRLAGIIDTGRIRRQPPVTVAEKTGAIDTNRNKNTDTTGTLRAAADTGILYKQ